MEYATEQSLRCSGCGWPRDISTADGADEDFEAVPKRCHACYAIHGRQKRWKGDDLPAHYFQVRHTPSERATT